jgi:hypothetical protein
MEMVRNAFHRKGKRFGLIFFTEGVKRRNHTHGRLCLAPLLPEIRPNSPVFSLRFDLSMQDAKTFGFLLFFLRRFLFACYNGCDLSHMACVRMYVLVVRYGCNVYWGVLRVMLFVLF